MIKKLDHFTRAWINSNPNDIFVFGDNMTRKGYGGQAAAARDCVNAVGIPTKWRPDNTPAAYFKDSDYDFVQPVIWGEITKLRLYLSRGRTIVLPSDGIGTGLARLELKAPRIFDYIQHELIALHTIKVD